MTGASPPDDRSGGDARIETILIVDDEPDIAELFAEWLTDEYEVHVVHGGTEALERCDDTIDIVLLDRRMPTPDGDEVLSTLTERGYDGHVVMVTAVEPDFDIIDLGFDDYLLKPASRADLLGVVDSLAKRDRYGERVVELFGAISKRAHLQAHKPDAALAENEAYQALEDRIETLERETQTLALSMDGTEAAAVLRDVTGQRTEAERE